MNAPTSPTKTPQVSSVELTPASEIDAVIELIGRLPLRPSFLDLMWSGDLPYETAARLGVNNPEWGHGSPPSVPRWIDGDPIHPGHPNARRFFGNFVGLSRVFVIDTDDEDAIARLRAAIADNATVRARLTGEGA